MGFKNITKKRFPHAYFMSHLKMTRTSEAWDVVLLCSIQAQITALLSALYEVKTSFSQVSFCRPLYLMLLYDDERMQ